MSIVGRQLISAPENAKLDWNGAFNAR